MNRFARRRRFQPEPRYSMRETIGEGPVGQLWLAQDALTGRRVTIRTFPQEISRDPRFVERLRTEIALLTRPVVIDGRFAHRLSHEHVARVLGLDLEHESNRPLLVLEPVSGRLLSDVIDAEKPDLRQVARICSQAAGGLDAMHRAGVVHGGLHPGSLLLTAEGRCLLVDIGVMRGLLSVSSATDLIRPLRGYFAPELNRGSEPSASSDVYSLGALVVKMLTGQPPRGSVGPSEGPSVLTAEQHEVLGRVRGQGAEVVLGALAANPMQRPSAAAVASALSAIPKMTPTSGRRWAAGLGGDPDRPDGQPSDPRDGQPTTAMSSGGPALLALPGFNTAHRWTPEASLRHFAGRSALTSAGSGAPGPSAGHPKLNQPTSATRPQIFESTDPSTFPPKRSSPPSRTTNRPRSPRIARRIRRASKRWTSNLHSVVDDVSTRIGRGTHRRVSTALSGLARGGRRLSRPPTVWYASAVAALLVAAAILALSLGGREPVARPGPAQSPLGGPRPAPANVASPALYVPVLTGVTAADARDRLTQLGLRVARVEATPGTPGVVLRTDPVAGAQVSPGESVTLFVGAPRNRVGPGGFD
jgi:serine/threonine protein kinase